MGGQNEKYIKTREVTLKLKKDIVESLVKKGADLSKLRKDSNCTEDILINLKFMPNNWSLLHLAVWYGNTNLVKELIQQEKCNVNLKDEVREK